MSPRPRRILLLLLLLPLLGLGLGLGLGPSSLVAGPSGGEADESESYRGSGLCRFRVHDYVLPPTTEAAINKVIGDSLQQHRQAFGFEVRPDFQLRIRIFGKFSAFEQFTRTNGHLKSLSLHSQSITNLNGYYSGENREIVTWRQHQPSYLANNLLHEASHAILDAHYRRVPTWVSEGAATYYAFPNQLQDQHDLGLIRYRWAALNRWLRDKRLPELEGFLNLSHEEWTRLNPNLAYTVSWSLFQHLMSAPAKRQALQQLMNELQVRRPPEPAAALARHYPGGLSQFTKDWHQWIEKTGKRLFGSELDELVNQVR